MELELNILMRKRVQRKKNNMYISAILLPNKLSYNLITFNFTL